MTPTHGAKLNLGLSSNPTLGVPMLGAAILHLGKPLPFTVLNFMNQSSGGSSMEVLSGHFRGVLFFLGPNGCTSCVSKSDSISAQKNTMRKKCRT